GDEYYFSQPGSAVRLPVYRLLLRDGTDTRYYVDPVAGTLIARMDRADQHYRWWHEALHEMDFAAIFRGRPQWDVLMWLLMAGVTTVCASGTYLGYRRLTR
ncbi:MAG: PepSY domain-containing protein, partial [Steroidobacteraceae bacterium]